MNARAPAITTTSQNNRVSPLPAADGPNGCRIPSGQITARRRLIS